MESGRYRRLQFPVSNSATAALSTVGLRGTGPTGRNMPRVQIGPSPAIPAISSSTRTMPAEKMSDFGHDGGRTKFCGPRCANTCQSCQLTKVHYFRILLLCYSCIFMLVIWENFQVRNGMSKMDKDRPFRLFPLSKVAATRRCKTISVAGFYLHPLNSDVQTYRSPISQADWTSSKMAKAPTFLLCSRWMQCSGGAYPGVLMAVWDTCCCLPLNGSQVVLARSLVPQTRKTEAEKEKKSLVMCLSIWFTLVATALSLARPKSKIFTCQVSQMCFLGVNWIWLKRNCIGNKYVKMRITRYWYLLIMAHLLIHCSVFQSNLNCRKNSRLAILWE